MTLGYSGKANMMGQILKRQKGDIKEEKRRHEVRALAKKHDTDALKPGKVTTNQEQLMLLEARTDKDGLPLKKPDS